MTTTPHRQITYLRTLGLLFCLAGGTVVVLGWHGSAKLACVDCQFPYLISGGAGGIALVVLGVGLLIVAQIRVESAHVAQHLDRLIKAGAGAAATVRPDASDLVLAGDSAYHRPDCRLVSGHDELATLTVDMAEADGLAPCRVCWRAGDPAETQRFG